MSFIAHILQQMFNHVSSHKYIIAQARRQAPGSVKIHISEVVGTPFRGIFVAKTMIRTVKTEWMHHSSIIPVSLCCRDLESDRTVTTVTGDASSVLATLELQA